MFTQSLVCRSVKAALWWTVKANSRALTGVLLIRAALSEPLCVYDLCTLLLDFPSPCVGQSHFSTLQQPPFQWALPSLWTLLTLKSLRHVEDRCVIRMLPNISQL